VAYPTKIATCCFCGSKAALTLAEGRHELACAQCGAPLHDLKQLPVPKTETALRAQPRLREFAPTGKKGKPAKLKVKKPKRRKSWLRSVGDELFDVVEDLFD
jgi:hypothetical protein